MTFSQSKKQKVGKGDKKGQINVGKGVKKAAENVGKSKNGY